MGKQGKNNALILYQVLMKYSDKEHPLSMSDIKDYMAEETAECGRDSIARYLNQLEEEMGIYIGAKVRRQGIILIGDFLIKKNLS